MCILNKIVFNTALCGIRELILKMLSLKYVSVEIVKVTGSKATNGDSDFILSISCRDLELTFTLHGVTSSKINKPSISLVLEIAVSSYPALNDPSHDKTSVSSVLPCSLCIVTAQPLIKGNCIRLPETLLELLI